jgi:hypothetical protein
MVVPMVVRYEHAYLAASYHMLLGHLDLLLGVCRHILSICRLWS